MDFFINLNLKPVNSCSDVYYITEQKMKCHKTGKKHEKNKEYDQYDKYRSRAKRPTSQKWTIEIYPLRSVVQFILLCYFWIY